MIVKICGITHPDDAFHASSSGADRIGVVFSKLSRRCVTLSFGISIAEAARSGGAEPVGVFVEQAAEEIVDICEATGIKTVQLHGEVAKKAVHALSGRYAIIYALTAEEDGDQLSVLKTSPSIVPLYDNMTGGSGTLFDWTSFLPPAYRPWMLAGGLNPENVAKAIALLQPDGVDVATGVECPHSIRKDQRLVTKFIQAAKTSKELS